MPHGLEDRGPRARDRAAKAFGVSSRYVESAKIDVSVKVETEHGRWLPWLRENFGWAERTARGCLEGVLGDQAELRGAFNHVIV